MRLSVTTALLLFSSSLIAQFNIAIIDFSGKNVSLNCLGSKMWLQSGMPEPPFSRSLV